MVCARLGWERAARPQAGDFRFGETMLAESFVVRMGPAMEMKPQRLWRDPMVPDYGRAVVIAALPGLNLTPGELLHVRFAD